MDPFILNRTVKSVNNHLANLHEFDQAALEAYDFFWQGICAYYVEFSKPILFGKAGTPEDRTNKQKLLLIVLCQAIRLMHPMAPFITEEPFHLLKERFKGIELLPHADPYTTECIKALQSAACIVSSFPQVVRKSDQNPEIEATFALLEQVIYTIRNIRGEMNFLRHCDRCLHHWQKRGPRLANHPGELALLISALVRTNKIVVQPAEPTLGFVCTGVCRGLRIILPLPEEAFKTGTPSARQRKREAHKFLKNCVRNYPTPNLSAKPRLN